MCRRKRVRSQVEPGCYELVFGHRRVAAYRILHMREPENPRWARIPLLIVCASDQSAFEAAMSENVQRDNFNPIIRARYIQYYIEAYGVTQLEAGRHFKFFSQGAVSNIMRLLKLPLSVQDKIERGIISESQARTLLRLSAEAATRIANAMAQLSEEDRQACFGKHVAQCLRKVPSNKSDRRRGPRKGCLVKGGICPTCRQQPENYRRGEDSWLCGACGATVALRVA